MWSNITLSFCSIFLTIFTTEVSSVHPTSERHIFIHNMDSISILRWKKIWRIIGGGQSNNSIFIGNRYGIWDQIWGIPGSFMRTGSIINGDWR